MLTRRAHRRFNPLIEEWVLVSPHRLQRPWQGRTEAPPQVPSVAYDPACYLCPGNTRAGGARNPAYTRTFVFDNDYPALGPPAPDDHAPSDGLLASAPEPGICRVICFSPRHDLSLARLSSDDAAHVVAEWTAQYVALGAEPWINHVAIFENRGASMGASNPHPHGQIWATGSVPGIAAREHAALGAYHARTGACLLCAYLALEIERGERVVYRNDGFVVLVPFWAVWPYETMILPTRHVTGLDAIGVDERAAFADALQRTSAAYDRLFEAPCAYSMGIHQRPTDGAAHPAWHVHVHFFPPALRSATVHKFLVGFELLAMPQRDLTPEAAAERLRGVIQGS